MQDGFDFQQVIPGIPPGDGMESARIVANHPPNHCPVGCRGFRSELQPMRLQKGIKVVSDNTRLHPHPFLCNIHFQNIGKILGDIYYNAVAHYLSGQGGTCRPWNQRGFMVACQFNEFADILRIARDGNCLGHFLVF